MLAEPFFVHENQCTQILNLSCPDQSILSPRQLLIYVDTAHGFIDCAVIPISRLNSNQQVLFNGHKRIHNIKFQSLDIPNGLIGNFSGQYESGCHDSTMLQESGLLTELQDMA